MRPGGSFRCTSVLVRGMASAIFLCLSLEVKCYQLVFLWAVAFLSGPQLSCLNVAWRNWMIFMSIHPEAVLILSPVPWWWGVSGPRPAAGPGPPPVSKAFDCCPHLSSTPSAFNQSTLDSVSQSTHQVFLKSLCFAQYRYVKKEAERVALWSYHPVSNWVYLFFKLHFPND